MTTMPTRALAELPDMARATNFSASDAKAKLGQMIDLVAAGGVATITRRGRQQFAVLRLETVEALLSMAREHELESLGSRYDDLVARMQTPKAKAAVDSLFSARPEDIGAVVGGTSAAGAIGSATVGGARAAGAIGEAAVVQVAADRVAVGSAAPVGMATTSATAAAGASASGAAAAAAKKKKSKR